jgi:large subunit ribosomal protein L10
MRPEKQLLLDEIKGKIDESAAFIITSYQGLTALAAYDFRNKIAKSGGDFEVVRKRVFLKAAQDANIEIDPALLQGHIGVVFSREDIVAAAKAVVQYDKENKGVVMVLGGISEGNLLDAQQVVVMSTLPDKDTMRAQLLGLFEAPMSQTLATMEALLTSVLHCLDNKAKKETENQV